MGIAAGFMLVGHFSRMEYHTRCAEGPFPTSGRAMALLLWHTCCLRHTRTGPATASGSKLCCEAKEAYMPTYDYYCRACDRTFEMHLSLQEHDAHQVQCPHYQSPEVEQVLTLFSTVTSKKS